MGTLRIVAGSLKGRRLKVPPGSRVRPTADRVREALFSILGGNLSGCEVLDAYAGSGAIGFEALSRGARRATFLEADRRAARTLRENARALGVTDRAVVLVGEALRLVREAELGGPFDVVFSDPPYASGRREAFLQALASARRVAPGGIVVLERDARSAPAEGVPAFRLVRTAAYGRAALDFYSPEAA